MEVTLDTYCEELDLVLAQLKLSWYIVQPTPDRYVVVTFPRQEHDRVREALEAEFPDKLIVRLRWGALEVS